MFLSTLYRDCFPDSGLKPCVRGLSPGPAAAAGYLRIVAGKHVLTDVLVGALVGGAIGQFIPKVHETSGGSTDPIVPGGAVPIQMTFRLAF